MIVAQVSASIDSQLASDFQHLKSLYQAQPFPEYEQRVQWLNRLKKGIQQFKHELALAISQDFGHRSTVETQLAELFPAIESIKYAKRHLKEWMMDEPRHISVWFKPARASVMYQPVGVVGIIVPWNYPIFLALGPLIGALAAGNRVLLKLSEFTPETNKVLLRLLDTSLGEEVVKVVEGDAALAAQFSQLPFDHLLFTGSTTVGRKVMQAAAANLTPVTLELGGKSPVIVSSGFSSARAAKRIVAGKLLNAGQTCVAPDYVLVKESDTDALIEAILDAARQFYPNYESNSDYSSIINDKQYARLQSWLKEAEEAGAEILYSQKLTEAAVQTRKMPLIIIKNADPNLNVMTEEIFGPILPIISYKKIDDAIRWVNERPRPLALYLFDDNPIRVKRILSDTISGGVTINDTLIHVAQEDLPFGGVGASGMGSYHGFEGFKTFSKAKPIMEQTLLNGMKLTLPPYGKKIKLLLKLMLR